MNLKINIGNKKISINLFKSYKTLMKAFKNYIKYIFKIEIYKIIGKLQDFSNDSNTIGQLNIQIIFQEII